MPSTDDPGPIDGLTYTAAEWRRMMAMELQANGSAGGSLGGIRPGDPGLGVTLPSPYTTITVSAGVAAVAWPGSGVYNASLPTAKTLTLTAANATNPRIDLVYLRVWDSAIDGTGLYQVDAVYLAGTAAVSPSAPVPGALEIYIPLATISVPKSGNGNPSVLSTVRAVTVAPGGISPSASVAGTYAGQYRDGGTLQRYSGSAWEDKLYLAAGGQLNIGASSSSAALAAILASAGTLMQSTRVTGDTNNRYQLQADGKSQWGDGTLATDTTLARTAAGVLTLTGALAATNGLSVAAGVGSMRSPYKAADAAARVSTTTLAVDTDLVITVEANATYALSGHLQFSAAAGGDIKFDWLIPAGASLNWALLGTGTVNFTDNDASIVSATTARGARGNGSTVQSANPQGTLVVSSTAGSIQLRWAQNTSNATGTILKAGSRIRLDRIG